MNDPAIATVGGGRPALTGTAADVMNPGPRTCSRFSRVIEAVLIFKDEDCGMVPVVEEGKPVGVVTDRDIALALATYDDLVDRPIEEIMITSVVTVPKTASIADVVRTFGREAVRRLLVVDENGLLVGVISWKDLCAEVTERAVGHVVTEVVESPA
jgi:CBS domain-containing protein